MAEVEIIKAKRKWYKMPIQQKNKEKLPEVVKFIFRFAGAFVRLSFVRIGKKVPVFGSLGKAIEVAFRLGIKDNKSTSSLKTEHATANTGRTKIQKNARETQSQLLSQLQVSHWKDEFTAVAEKIGTIKTEIDQLSHQVCDCSSQAQPGAIETSESTKQRIN